MVPRGWFCSVVLLVGLPGQKPPPQSLQESLQQRVEAALSGARPALLEHLRIQKGGVLALVALAAVHDHVPLGQPTLRHALQRVSRGHWNGTYEAAIRLMLIFEVANFPRREKLIATDTKTILRNRVRGGFSYAKRQREPDLSNTQYAALGLRAAVALGQSIEPRVWRDLARVVLGMQAEDGGFGYTRTSRRKRPYASMTVAGIAVLQVCSQMLHPKGEEREHMREAIGQAWHWLEQHRMDIGSLDTPSTLYFHYGLERAAILSGVEKVGGRDWYGIGAEMLLGMQMRSGAWRSFMEIRPGALGGKGSPVDTAFAILFLRRAFRRELRRPGPITPGRSRVLQLGAAATEAEIRAAVEAATRRGLVAVPDLLRAFGSSIAARRRAGIEGLRKVTGRSFASLKEAERWWLRRRRR